MRYAAAILVAILFGGNAYAQEESTPPGPQKPPAGHREDTREELTPAQVAALVRRLGSRFLSERLDALKQVTGAGQAAVAPLKEALGSKNHLLRMGAANALARMKQPEVVPPLLEMLNDSNLAVRGSALQALVSGGPEILAQIDSLRESGLVDIDEDRLSNTILPQIYRKLFKTALEKINPLVLYPGQYAAVVNLGPKVIPTLLELLERQLDKPGVRLVNGGATYIIRALTEFKDKRATERIKALWDDPRAKNYRSLIASSLAKLGFNEFFEKEVKKLLEAATRNPGSISYRDVGFYYHTAGRYDEGVKWWRKVVQAAEKEGSSHGVYYCNLACALSMEGKLDEAVEAMKKAFEKGGFGYDCVAEDKELDPIREHPGFIKLIKKYCPEYLPEKHKPKKNGNKEDKKPPGIRRSPTAK